MRNSAIAHWPSKAVMYKGVLSSTISVQIANCVVRICEPLLCCFAPPIQSCLKVLFDTQPVKKKNSHLVLFLGIALLSFP